MPDHSETQAAGAEDGRDPSVPAHDLPSGRSDRGSFAFRAAWVVVLIAGLACIVVALRWTSGLGDQRVLDEAGHYEQIETFLGGRLVLSQRPGEEYPTNAMLPGFHALMAALAFVTGLHDPASIRWLCFAVSPFLALAAYALARRTEDRDVAVLRAAQAYFLPMIFPFHFLIYTDGLSSVLCLAALLALLHKRLLLAGFVATCSLLVRQTNVMFAALLLGMHYIDALGRRWSVAGFRRQTRQVWPLWVPIGLFVAFFLVHGRVNMDVPAVHPLVISWTNVKFSLALCGLLFVPWHVRYAWRICTRGRLGAVVLPCLVAAAVLAFLPSQLHSWNRLDFLFRNHVLVWMASLPGRLVSAGLISLALLSFTATPLVGRSAYVLYPYWLLLLLPMWLVEPRYYAVPFLLFTLLRKAESRWVELGLAVIQMAAGMGMYSLLFSHHLLP